MCVVMCMTFGYLAIDSIKSANRPRPIMLKILPIVLLSRAQKIAHYAQYYAHKY